MCYDHIQRSLTQTRLKELHERSGITRDELVKLTGAEPKTLEAIESGKYDPPLSMAYKIAAAFKVNVEDLYTDRPERAGTE